MKEKIVIADDEKEIADLVEVYLRNEGYEVYKFYNGADAMKCMEQMDIDMAILDVMLPDTDGFHLCKKIRQSYTFPIIMLTAKTETTDKIMGLTYGADDYITKPFNPLELVARVKTGLRRYIMYNAAGHSDGEYRDLQNSREYNIRGLHISKSTHKCILNEEELALTPIEFSILWYLCENRGTVIPSEVLYENVWGEKYFDSNNTIMAHIARLREKMHEVPRKPKYIKTVWGVGYTIE